MVVKGVSQYLGGFTKCFPHRSPNPLHWLVCKSFIFILVINSSKEECIKPHFGKETSVCTWMAKWINLPSNSWSNSKLLHYKVMANHHIVNHIFVVRAGFIVHWPAGIQKFKTTFTDKGAYLILQFLSLVLPPHGKEFHLDIWKSLSWVVNKLWNNFVEYELHFNSLNIIIYTRKVFINCFQPANIIMSVMC